MMTREEAKLVLSAHALRTLAASERLKIVQNYWSIGPEDDEWLALPEPLREVMRRSDELPEEYAEIMEPLVLVGLQDACCQFSA